MCEVFPEPPNNMLAIFESHFHLDQLMAERQCDQSIIAAAQHLHTAMVHICLLTLSHRDYVVGNDLIRRTVHILQSWREADQLRVPEEQVEKSIYSYASKMSVGHWIPD